MAIQCSSCGSELTGIGSTCPVCSKRLDVEVKGPITTLGLCGVCGKSVPKASLINAGKQLVCQGCHNQAALHQKLSDGQRQEKENRFQATDMSAEAPSRNTQRFTIPRAMATLKRRNWTHLIGPHEGVGVVLDLSCRGVQCLSSTEFKRKDKVSISLTIPAYRQPLEFTGRVQWVRPAANTQYRLGIQFTNLTQDLKEHLFNLQSHDSLRNVGETTL